jgi:hypothetical protein
MIRSLARKSSVPLVAFEAPTIPPEVLAVCDANRITELKGTFGDPMLGAPIQYDYLTISGGSNRTSIELFNRAIVLFMSDDEDVKRIHRVMSLIQRHAETDA